MKVIVRKVKRVKVCKTRRSAYDQRRKMELIRMIEDLNPALYDDAKSHLKVLLAVR